MTAADPEKAYKLTVPAQPDSVTAVVTKDQSTDQWVVEITISHVDQTVVRINGRAIWQGTP